MKHQTDITEMLVKHQQLACLSQQDIPVPCGDPLDCTLFLKAFEHIVDSKTDNSADKLYFLEQYTRGEPQDRVKICQHILPDHSYQESMHLLEDHYGNTLNIATALMERVWPQRHSTIVLSSF